MLAGSPEAEELERLIREYREGADNLSRGALTWLDHKLLRGPQSTAQREAADARSEQLLEELFGTEALALYRKSRYVKVPFKLPLMSEPGVALVFRAHVVTIYQSRSVQHCVAPYGRGGYLNNCDGVITMALRIKAGPDAFFHEAKPGAYYIYGR